MKCALIAPPWPIFNRPSIQLAVLSAYLRHNLTDVDCRCFHPYLALYANMGADDYSVVAESSWASEAIGAMIFDPTYMEKKVSMALKALHTKGVRWKAGKVCEVSEKLLRTLDGWVRSKKWEEYALVGISVSLNQLLSGLYIAQKIKGISPFTRVVIGGASVSGPVGQWLLDEFEFIDAIIGGEGEIPHLSIVKNLKGDGQWIRQVMAGRQVEDLNNLPPPDYDDFFRELSALPPRLRFMPTLPIEFSRGCFWGRCAFCNLNVQWHGYRQKSHLRMKKEVLRLLYKYKCMDFAFMDNALPPKESVHFFSAMGESGYDLRFFGELRASISRDEAKALGRAGLKRVQVGIEALSDAFLSRMKKGRSVMENLAAMKHLLEAGICLDGNLIMDFPDTQDHEIRETLKNLEYARFFRPLKAVSFWLGYGCPVFLNPREYGIKRICPHKNYSVLFAGKSRITGIICDYMGTKRADRSKWQPVRVAMKKWHDFWTNHSINDPPLTYRDGGSVLMVRQSSEDGTIYQHRFTGASREMFLDMLKPMRLEFIFTKYDKIPKDRIMAFLKDLSQKHIVYSNGIEALALPVRKK